MVKIEGPYKKRELAQCLNCQKYGHTKAYCAHTHTKVCTMY